MKDIKIGVIGGTGVYNFNGIKDKRSVEVETKYGIVPVNTGKINSKQVAFIARHGHTHGISPGHINYRANIAALKKLGVKYVFATACSGSINPKYKVGDLVMLDQFLEFTKNRADTFLSGEGGKHVGHIDNTVPYCKAMQSYIINSGKMLGETIKDGAVYCCMEGPRFESSAEIKMLQLLKADIVGQTNYPEVVLAREAELCY